MNFDDPASLTAAHAASLIARGALSAEALLDACLQRIAKSDGSVRAWVYVDESGARGTARERDAEARAGRRRGSLHGVPVGIKDIFHVAGIDRKSVV